MIFNYIIFTFAVLFAILAFSLSKESIENDRVTGAGFIKPSMWLSIAFLTFAILREFLPVLLSKW